MVHAVERAYGNVYRAVHIYAFHILPQVLYAAAALKFLIVRSIEHLVRAVYANHVVPRRRKLFAESSRAAGRVKQYPAPAAEFFDVSVYLPRHAFVIHALLELVVKICKAAVSCHYFLSFILSKTML